MNNITPGPWEWIGPWPNGSMLLAGRTRAVIFAPILEPIQIDPADKAAIEATPDLLAACEAVIQRGFSAQVEEQIRAAITKATTIRTENAPR